MIFETFQDFQNYILEKAKAKGAKIEMNKK